MKFLRLLTLLVAVLCAPLSLSAQEPEGGVGIDSLDVETLLEGTIFNQHP